MQQWVISPGEGENQSCKWSLIVLLYGIGSLLVGLDGGVNDQALGEHHIRLGTDRRRAALRWHCTALWLLAE